MWIGGGDGTDSASEVTDVESKKSESNIKSDVSDLPERDWKELPPGVNPDDTDTDDDNDDDENSKDDPNVSWIVKLFFCNYFQSPFSPDLSYTGPEQISTPSVGNLSENYQIIRLVEITEEEVINQSSYSLQTLPARLTV
jgi:hypothetical protein